MNERDVSLARQWKSFAMRTDPDLDYATFPLENLAPRMPETLLDWLFEEHRFEFAVLMRQDLVGRLTSLVEHIPRPWPLIVPDAEQARLGRQRLIEAAARGSELIVATSAPIDDVRRLVAPRGLLHVEEPPPHGLIGAIALATRLGATSLCAFGHDAEIFLLSRALVRP
jgi:hypothetical protein